MIEFTNTIEIDRSVEDVFAYLRDLENAPEWNWAIADTRKITPGPVAEGTRYSQVRTAPDRTTEELEITALEPNELIEVSGDLAQFAAHLTYRLDVIEVGTLVSNKVELEGRGGRRLLAPFLSGRIEEAVASNLQDLKRQLERS